MQVVYNIHGDLPDCGSRASVLCDAPLTLRKLQNQFPFEGTFHFRQKVLGTKCGVPDCEYLWLDITEMDRTLDCDDNIVEVQALLISLPDYGESCYDPDANYDEYIEELNRYVPTERQNSSEARLPKSSSLSSDEHVVGSSSVFVKGGSSSTGNVASNQTKPVSTLKSIASTVKSSTAAAKNLNISLDSVKSGASSIWNKVKATAAHLQQQAASAANDSATAKLANEMLALLAKDVNTTFSDSSQFHVQLLARLWSVQFPGRPFERTSPTWKLGGWQKEDPIADLKNSGLLAIHSMIYLGETEAYAETAQQMLQNNQANKKNNYPFAIVGVNLTLLLAELFKLRDPALNSSREPFGALFADLEAFNEVCWGLLWCLYPELVYMLSIAKLQILMCVLCSVLCALCAVGVLRVLPARGRRVDPAERSARRLRQDHW